MSTTFSKRNGQLGGGVFQALGRHEGSSTVIHMDMDRRTRKRAHLHIMGIIFILIGSVITYEPSMAHDACVE